MEGKVWGILLSVLGIAGLIWALIYINGPLASLHMPVLVAAGVCGALAFFIGIWLIDHKRSGAKVRA
ncbi:MAG TPA: hypothetical protein VGS79_05710 [Puia sp.]|nr:hypothetical protein [Puia sp.]